jgi:hypothetical protein
MNAAYPTGTYLFAATKIAGTQNASFNYTGDAYPQTQPYLDGTSFTDLRTFNPYQPLAIQLSPLVPDPAANPVHIFFNIFDPAANQFAYVANFLPATTTFLRLPANTLKRAHTYRYELTFSDRVVVPISGAQFSGQIGFQYLTSAQFTTADIPEPMSLVLLAMGLGALTLGRRRPWMNASCGCAAPIGATGAGHFAN